MSTLDKIMSGAVRSLTLDLRREVTKEVMRLRKAIRVAVTALDEIPATDRQSDIIIEGALIEIQNLGFRIGDLSEHGE